MEPAIKRCHIVLYLTDSVIFYAALPAQDLQFFYSEKPIFSLKVMADRIKYENLHLDYG